MASRTAPKGTLALIGGGEWGEHHRALDRRLLAISGGTEVVVIPTAASYEHPEQVGEAASEHWAGLGATATALPIVHRRDAETAKYVKAVEHADFVYLADGSPMHLRSVLKGSDLYEALMSAYHRGAVIAASGAAATVLCDPMVDPRGGAYTVGLGFVTGLAVFPYHGTAASHLLERSIELRPRDAILVGLDEETALVRAPDATWSVAGSGHATVYGDGAPQTYADGATGLALP